MEQLQSQICEYCGILGGHAMWCRGGVRSSAPSQKQVPLRKPATSEPSQNPPAGLIPSGELFAGDYARWLSAQESTPQGGGFKRTEAEIERETGERREFIVIERIGYQPGHASAVLVQILVKPDGRQLVRNIRILGEVLPLDPGEKAAGPLSGITDGIVVRLKPGALKGLD